MLGVGGGGGGVGWEKRIFILYWMWENRIRRDVEKAEVLNAFFTSVFSSKTSCSPSTQPSELVDKDLQQNEALMRKC